MKKKVIIETQKPLSQSQLWVGQRAFYDQKGVDAWSNEVPFYITSNPYIASIYAKIVINFIQDWLKKKPKSKSQTFYILELGAGSGQFSYFTLKKIIQLKEQFGLSQVNIRYVMSDFTEKNINFWKNHTTLRPFLEKKLLDFAIYDLEKDTRISLIEENVVWEPNSLKNPLIVFANYIFDSVKNDIFSIKNGQLKESLVTLKSTKKIDMRNGYVNWEKISVEFNERSIPDNYYSNETIDPILHYYKKVLKETQLLFPISAIRCLENLSKISKGKLLLISSDKGFNSLKELDELDYPELDFHGSFSLMVNYHAIGEYCKRNQGDIFLQTPRDGLLSAICAYGFRFDEFSGMEKLLEDNIEGFSPTDYFLCYEHLSNTANKASLEILLSFLCLSQWDTFLFYQIHTEIIKRLKKVDAQTLYYLKNNLPSVINNFYFLPGCDDIFFALGLIFYELDEYKTAIHYYLESEKQFQPCFQSAYNLGLCYYYDMQYSLAANFFEKALKFNPRAKQAKGLLRKATRRIKRIKRNKIG